MQVFVLGSSQPKMIDRANLVLQNVRQQPQQSAPVGPSERQPDLNADTEDDHPVDDQDDGYADVFGDAVTVAPPAQNSRAAIYLAGEVCRITCGQLGTVWFILLDSWHRQMRV